MASTCNPMVVLIQACFLVGVVGVVEVARLVEVARVVEVVGELKVS